MLETLAVSLRRSGDDIPCSEANARTSADDG